MVGDLIFEESQQVIAVQLSAIILSEKMVSFIKWLLFYFQWKFFPPCINPEIVFSFN